MSAPANSKQAVLQRFAKTRVVVVLRVDLSWDELRTLAELCLEHGFDVLELTLDKEQALAHLGHLNRHFGTSLLLGAGTVRSPETLEAAVAAGADFIVSPHLSVALLEAAKAHNTCYIPGVYTPSDVQTACDNGYRTLKLFPAGSGGPAHLQALRGPFPDVAFIPTGGISEEQVASYLRAGAVAVGLGSSLLKTLGDRQALKALSARLRDVRKHVESVT